MEQKQYLDTEAVLTYLKENPVELYRVCDELKLRFPYENKEKLMEVYNHLKSVCRYYESRRAEGDARYSGQEANVRIWIGDMERNYHMFSPDFDEESEKRWIPKEYTQDAHDLWEFRKKMYGTQHIYEDHELTNIICDDMGYIWNKKGGQDGMYDTFPITFTRESVVRECDRYCDYLESDCHYTEKLIRSYALNSCGGVAIIEHRTYCHYANMDKIRPEAQDSYLSTFQIVTLGEDDAYHFLNSARIYESYCGGSSDDFLNLLKMATEEFKNHNNDCKELEESRR